MLSAGSRLGPYEVVALLGCGGMGEVYRAHDPRLQRDVAIKVIGSDLVNDPDALARFEREARAVAALAHPNIVGIFDYEAGPDGGYAVTELLDGETLRDRVSRGALPTATVIAYGRQIAEGLAAAHEKGIVHRDLKPENVFLTTDGVVKILDFGLARAVVRPEARADTATQLTDRAVVAGTAPYMSPEQVRGQPLDARSDLFALGAVLYELCTGRKAFHRESAVETMHAILNEEPAGLAALVPAVPADLATLIQRLLIKIPAQRLQSARDVVFALTDVRPTADLVDAASASPRSRWRRVAVMSALAAAGALVGYLAAGRLAVPTDRPAGDVVAERLTDRAGLEESPALSPDGRAVAFLADGDGHRQVWVQMRAGGPPLQLTRDPADHQHPRWTADSTAIIYYARQAEADASGSLFEVPLLGGTPRRIASSLTGADLSHDGRRLAFFRLQEGRAELVTANRDGADVVVVAPLEAGRHYGRPRWSPDDSAIAFQAGLLFRFEVLAVPASGGTPRALTRHGVLSLEGFDWLPDGSGVLYSSGQASTVMYLPVRDLWIAPLGDARPRRVTSGDESYVEPDVHADGTITASRLRIDLDLWRFPVGGTPADNTARAERLTNQTGQVHTPSPSLDGQEIAYLADKGGHGNIWVLNVARGLHRQITFETDPGLVIGLPTWSPTGEYLTFVKWHAETAESELWLVRPDGSGLRRLAGAGGSASWAGDGRAVYSDDGRPGSVGGTIVRVGLDGGGVTTVRTDGGLRPRISPDGSTLAYVRDVPTPAGIDHEVRLATPPDGPSRAVVRVPAERSPPWLLFHPTWSPDGRWLTAALADGPASNVWLLSPADGSWKQVTDFGRTPTYIVRSVVWMPDGRSVVAAVGRGDADVVTLRGLVKGVTAGR